MKHVIPHKKAAVAVAIAVALVLAPAASAYASLGIQATDGIELSGQSLKSVKSGAKTTKNEAKFAKTKISLAKRFKCTTGTYEYEKLLVKGAGGAVKKINKALERSYKQSLKLKKSLLSFAKADRSGISPYWYKVKTTPTYNKNGYLSVHYKTDWYAGGIHPTSWAETKTFSLKTGKELNLSHVVGGNAQQVKRKVASKFIKKYAAKSIYDKQQMRSEIMSKDISYFQFYLKDGKVVVELGEYAFGVPYASGWASVTLVGSYQ